MNRGHRPINVTAGAWIVIAVGALMLISGLTRAAQALQTPLRPLLFVTFVPGLVFSAWRLVLGVGILIGANWARLTYLIAEFVMINAAVIFLGEGDRPVTSAHIVSSVLPGVAYLIVLILLTRRSALAFFGRPVAPAMSVGGVIIALILFCFVYAGVARVASVIGLRAMSMASDDWNPVVAAGNAIGDATGLAWIESSTYAEVKALSRSIKAAMSLDQLGDKLTSPAFAARVAVNQNQPQVFLLWLVHLVGLPIILRRH